MNDPGSVEAAGEGFNSLVVAMKKSRRKGRLIVANDTLI